MGGAQGTMSVATTDTSVQIEDIHGTFLSIYQIFLIYICMYYAYCLHCKKECTSPYRSIPCPAFSVSADVVWALLNWTTFMCPHADI